MLTHGVGKSSPLEGADGYVANERTTPSRSWLLVRGHADMIDTSPHPRPQLRWPAVALFIVLDIALVGTLIALVVAPRLCLVTEPERHGLACDVPLPPTAVFERTVEISGEIPPGVEIQNLQLQVRDTTLDEVRNFYLQQLPLKGWTCAKVENAHIITAQKGNRD